MPEHAAPRVVEKPVRPAKAATRARLIGFLISYDNETQGEVFEIRTGRWLLTSRPSGQGDAILVEDESISPLHAILRGTNEGTVQVLDQLSEFGTGVIRAGSDKEEEVLSSLATLAHGDVVRFGKRHFVVCLIPSKVKIPAREA
jgi:pSer/pThr/pTyr-binding forkhead associated (FHA) protein